LSGSSLGLLGLGVANLIFRNKLSFFRIITPLILITFTLITVYSIFPPFKIRVNDTVKAISNKDVSGINLSSYALMANLYVSLESFKTNPLWGSGIGSHEISHKKFLKDIEGIGDFEEYEHL